MTRLLNFTRTQERGKGGFFVSRNEGVGEFLYSGGGNMNGRSFNKV